MESHGRKWSKFKSKCLISDNGGEYITVDIVPRMGLRWWKMYLEILNKIVWLKGWIGP